MKIYRVHSHTENGISAGYSFHSSLKDAKHAAREAWETRDSDSETPPEIEVLEVEISKAGILRALNMYASHAENG